MDNLDKSLQEVNAAVESLRTRCAEKTTLIDNLLREAFRLLAETETKSPLDGFKTDYYVVIDNKRVPVWRKDDIPF